MSWELDESKSFCVCRLETFRLTNFSNIIGLASNAGITEGSGRKFLNLKRSARLGRKNLKYYNA